ncbi:MAG: type II toxin-antitoxin system RelE/ParE family toxin [Planctomycetota bacterium]|nr:type II toxin-antitoxin system RelE/ParE family toxin [Planctomycetota bacterium]
MITPEAEAAIDRDIAYIRLQASQEIADRWYHGLTEAIRSLSSMPARCGVIPEQWLFDDELRQLLYGRKHHKRRIIFFIDDATVYVVRYQHGSLPPLSRPEDLGPPLLPGE